MRRIQHKNFVRINVIVAQSAAYPGVGKTRGAGTVHKNHNVITAPNRAAGRVCGSVGGNGSRGNGFIYLAQNQNACIIFKRRGAAHRRRIGPSQRNGTVACGGF